MPETFPSDFAQGRISQGPPIATIDIGSNSVRLVAYEGLTRSPTPVYNEKVLAGLGRNVTTTGHLDRGAVQKALGALRRFRVLCDSMGVKELYVLATAAARDASDGEDFISKAEEICRCKIEILSGKREAKLSAYGVISGFYRPDGIVGDMGGGSLELIEVQGHRTFGGVTTPLGGLALQDVSQMSIKKAAKVVKRYLDEAEPLKRLEGRTFYAVGGTWRSLARLLMEQRGYPLHVMHGYTVPAREMYEFCRIIARVDGETLMGREVVSSGRLSLLAYGATVLAEVIRLGKPRDIAISAFGVREGLLYTLLDAEQRKQDPLISAAREFNRLRARSPLHGEELVRWTDRFIQSSDLDETPDEVRVRHAASLLADIGWRAHPDYRGDQSLNMIANGAIIGVDHQGRVYMAIANYYRHAGLSDEGLSPRIREIATARILDRARILGALMRVAYAVTAAMPGVLPRTRLRVAGDRLVLDLPADLEGLRSDRLNSRMKTLGRLMGCEHSVEVLEDRGAAG